MIKQNSMEIFSGHISTPINAVELVNSLILNVSHTGTESQNDQREGSDGPN